MYTSAERSDQEQATAAGYHASLAVCVIEALQSSVTDESDTAVVVDRYVAYRHAQGEIAEADGVRALLRTFEEVGGCEQWAGKVGNYRRRYDPAGAPVAGAAIEHAAELFYTHRIDTETDLRRAADDQAKFASLESGLREITGSSDAWFTLLELAGLENRFALVDAVAA
ncbi:hypothetical protein [Antrihabitans cavernicola]|uniref:Uncharacterized protein n=1 Tax=Antrihabitans cavernicola TaxID=2495913 RepID=A0A5A7S8P7_9NOCA|nr:hypothetical protein [Spelaeibacter cavernicola]KAA0022510.1 hypothetical protein FOY51_12465 [Spelaeibacter cavernicola]